MVFVRPHVNLHRFSRGRVCTLFQEPLTRLRDAGLGLGSAITLVIIRGIHVTNCFYANRKIYFRARISRSMKLLVVGLLILLLYGCTQKPEGIRDPWSANCSSGTYSVNGSCEQPRSCVSDSDCSYLEVGKLPPRSGICVSGR